MTHIEDFLRQRGIPFERFDHPAVFTCEEAERLLPPMPGADTKNLLLRDKKGKRHVLVCLGYDKRANLKALADLLGADGLSFASSERMARLLGVEPGSVTLLGLVHDAAKEVEVVIDRELWVAPAMRCHPLVNTATLVIPHEGIAAFLAATGHVPRIEDLPG